MSRQKQQEVKTMNPLTRRAPMDNTTLILQYVGKMSWADKYGIDSRLWNVMSPKLKNYDYSSGGYPTFTLQGLKEKGLI
jgi:hypothetical protein